MFDAISLSSDVKSTFKKENDLFREYPLNHSVPWINYWQFEMRNKI
jgi:hypothetical protein